MAIFIETSIEWIYINNNNLLHVSLLFFFGCVPDISSFITAFPSPSNVLLKSSVSLLCLKGTIAGVYDMN
jgi:hypothetical protein